ncbi:YdeI/OmpD-associated family protein [Peredibacter sp. HCB2-198]|uniref:YdeI/OmpD-associated family protein n=1 Tax=Peredibacter sp. HCB2-198 TaxID=3383025 RepID=UPI0038B6A751
MNSKVEKYISSAKKWQPEMEALREILLTCPLEEEIKWGKPSYSAEGGNIVLIQDFKNYLALLFFKGGLMKDPKGVLVKMGENTQVGRQMRFADVKEVQKLKTTIKAYIKEAIAIVKSGEKVEVKPAKVKMAPELQDLFDKKPALKKAFESLTPGRQKAYHIYFSSAKQAATRLSRIEKYTKQILAGKGLND